jgi:hypothetical protein
MTQPQSSLLRFAKQQRLPRPNHPRTICVTISETERDRRLTVQSQDDQFEGAIGSDEEGRLEKLQHTRSG